MDRVQQWDLEVPLAEGLLTKADRASMSSAMELRAPFLDVAVLEFAASLPVRERVRGFTTKVFLKRYAARYLPGNIIHRRKRGLSVPLGRWLRGPMRDWAAASLEGRHLEPLGLRPAGARAIFQEHLDRKADHARALDPHRSESLASAGGGFRCGQGRCRRVALARVGFHPSGSTGAATQQLREPGRPPMRGKVGSSGDGDYLRSCRYASRSRNSPGVSNCSRPSGMAERCWRSSDATSAAGT